MTYGMSDRCAIVGIGTTPFVRGTDQPTLELHLEASRNALDDAGLAATDIDGVMPNDMAGRIAEEFVVNLGLHDLAFASTIMTGGASYLSAIQSACLAVHAGV